MASSITASLEKISNDARKAKDNFGELTVLIFVTPRAVTNHTKAEWAEEIREIFGYEWLVSGREDVIASLMCFQRTFRCAGLHCESMSRF